MGVNFYKFKNYILQYNMNCRNKTDLIILTIIPHLFTLFFTFNNSVYTAIVCSSSISSYLWHKNHEPRNHLLVCDYILAGTLSMYEIINIYNINEDWLYISIYINVGVLTFNKIVYILSLRRTVNYSKWHSLYHILSSVKSIFLAYLCCK